MDEFMTAAFDYDQMDQEERPFARRLALWIRAQNPQRVVDLGAGSGVYVEELRRLAVPAQGYDTADPQPRPDLVQPHNLLYVQDPADCVMCLEVAEHIQPDLAPAVVAAVWNWTQPGGRVIWSAAQPGQGGVGHINCQPPQYWHDLARQQGFQRDPIQELVLDHWIQSGYHMGWFPRNRQIWVRPR